MDAAIVVVGSVNQDMRFRTGRFPREGETILSRGLDRMPGGKGANQAIAITRHSDRRCHLIAAVGGDEDGWSLSRSLTAGGVDTSHVRHVEGARTGLAVVIVDGVGRNCIVVASGANMELAAHDVTGSLREIGAVSVVLAQGEVQVACISAAARSARQGGGRFVLNLAPYRDLPSSVLSACDPLIVNEHEARTLAESLELDCGSPEKTAKSLARVCRSVMVTWGHRGAVYAGPGCVGHIPAPNVDVVDTTGAGDAFVGAAVAALAGGASLAAACRAGVESGSQAVQHRGAQGGRVASDKVMYSGSARL